MGDARHHLKRVRRARVAAASVVCATAAGSDSQVLADTRFDLVVLDEATQAADPIALVALGRGDRVVLAGDPCQLPPTVIDRQAERGGLGVTLFERLVSDSVMLEVQHRMHETIMHFPSHSKYEGRLIAAPAVAAHTLADLGVADDPLRTGPLVFVDTAGKGWAEKRSTSMRPSTSNPAQAERTAAEVRRLLSRGLAPEHLAVITPYGAQVRLLRTILDIPGLDIGSIDGFQGREKEAVVVDLVRSNDNTDIGFLKDTRRMNVALTRARRFLLVIGDSATLGGHAYYDRFLSVVDDHGHWLSAWEDEAPVLD
jgi:ATP-dependent RNA/DNA helicase IGHMBP2